MVKTTMPAKPDGFAVQAANVDHLLQAVREGNVATVQSGCASLAGSDTRLSREAAASIKDSLGRGLLHVAAQCGHCNIIDYLVSDLQMLLDAQDDAGETPLALAAATGKAAALRQLMRLGADPTVRRDATSTAPVHRAASAAETDGQAPEVLRALLDDTRVAVDTPSSTGTPLCWAAGAGNIGAVKLLLDREADPNNPGCGEEPMPALSMAVAAHSCVCVERLLAAGARPSAPGRGGATPLHVAAAVRGNDEAACANVTALLQAGADANAHDRSDFTPVEVAIATENSKVADLLLSATEPIQGVEPWTMEGLTAHVHKKLGAMTSAGSSGEGVRVVRIPEPEEPDAEQAAAAKRKGDQAFVSQDYQSAADAYSVSLRHDTHNAVVWANRAAAYIKLGLAQEALSDAQKSRALDSKYVKAWYREAQAYEMLKDWEHAASCYYEGCTLAPGNTDFELAFKRAIEEAKREYQAAQAAKATQRET